MSISISVRQPCCSALCKATSCEYVACSAKESQIKVGPHPSHRDRPAKHDIRQARGDRIFSLYKYAPEGARHRCDTMLCKRVKRMRIKYKEHLTPATWTDPRSTTSAKQEGICVLVIINMHQQAPNIAVRQSSASESNEWKVNTHSASPFLFGPTREARHQRSK